MINVKIQAGDFFLVDSVKSGAKWVKFFQTAPTWIQHIWRKIRGTNEKVLYYHVGLLADKNTILEQQGKVIERDTSKLFSTNNNLLILRKKGLSEEQRQKILEVAREDLGEGYDIVNIFGKLFTWLTGLKFFARYMQLPNQDICVNRVSYWLKKATGETFGVKTHSELTTHIMWKYVIDRPEEFKIVYQGVPRGDTNE